MLQLEHGEYGPAQKRFERILRPREQGGDPDDPHALVALGNIWYSTAKPDVKEKVATCCLCASCARAHGRVQYEAHLERAMRSYRHALEKDPHNLYAACGIAMVTADRGETNRAKDIFLQARARVRDAMYAI
jgi:hypothetical protein